MYTISYIYIYTWNRKITSYTWVPWVSCCFIFRDPSFFPWLAPWLPSKKTFLRRPSDFWWARFFFWNIRRETYPNSSRSWFNSNRPCYRGIWCCKWSLPENDKPSCISRDIVFIFTHIRHTLWIKHCSSFRSNFYSLLRSNSSIQFRSQLTTTSPWTRRVQGIWTSTKTALDRCG